MCVCVCVCVRVRIVRVVFSLYVDASDGSAFDVCSQCVDCVIYARNEFVLISRTGVPAINLLTPAIPCTRALSLTLLGG